MFFRNIPCLDVKKRIYVSFGSVDALIMPPYIKNLTLNTNSFASFIRGYKIKCLEQPNGESVFEFDDLENGGVYKAITDFGGQINRCQIDDEVLEMETSQQLYQALCSSNKNTANAHMYQNLKVYEGNNKNVLSQFDAIFTIHENASNNTKAIVMEAKTKVHPNDLQLVLNRMLLFQNYSNFASMLTFTHGYDPLVGKLPFSLFSNITHVMPCLAGNYFPMEMVDDCSKNGIIHVFPSGARYKVKLLGLVTELGK